MADTDHRSRGFTTVTCSRCAEPVSGPVLPVGGPLVVRAFIECPECVEPDPPNVADLSAPCPRVGCPLGSTPDDASVMEAAARAMAAADNFFRSPATYVTLARVALAAAQRCIR